MRASWLFLLACAVHLPASAVLYKTVDAEGNVTYTDRPQVPGQEALTLAPPNITTPEARRQLALAEQRWQREEQFEFEASMRRWAAAHRAAPVGYSRALSPSAPRSTYVLPAFYFYTTPGPASQHRGHRHHRRR